ncbi:MAG: hypothetical protein FJX74_08975 [Armatimonadetes bacterium]|nr:hypothetical protein [Armatimonadota bacterium]
MTGTWPLLLASCLYAQPITPEAALDFEVEGAWLTAPDLLSEFKEEELWSTRTIPFAELAGGLTLATEHVHSGRTAGKWADHPRYPTIHTTRVPRDWSAARSLGFWAFSEEATGERITVAALSDSPETPWRDYLRRDLVVDWQGEREIALPLAGFTPEGSPVGWGKVDALYLFAKIDNREPNPYTVLYLDAMRLSDADAPPVEARAPAEEGRLPHEFQVPEFDASILNHRWPETRDGQPATAPIQYGSYFLAERALFGYYPRFQPGFVSFSPEGRAFIRYGSTIIQTVGPDGKWTYQDLLKEVIEPFARDTLGFGGIGIGNNGQGDEASLRFDAEGDAYALLFIWDPTRDARTRRGVLLHSRDGMQTWRAYVLPNYMARFEKFVGHNTDCLLRPPVILLSAYFAPTSIFLTIPEKQPDGSLVIPEPVPIAEGALPFLPHSGEANQALTVGDRVFVAYGKLGAAPGHTKADGVPNYAVAYDVKARALSEPVLMGFGGQNAEDDHNWASIALDGQGYLHALINGHHDPFAYVRAQEPRSIASWTAPEKVAAGTSYAGLVCGRDGTLYSVTRCAEPGYYFRLSLHRKRPGQPWEEPQHLVLPYKAYYHVWFHKLVIDPATDRLFLGYWAQSCSVCLFRDEYRAYVDIWPDRERPFLGKADGPKLPNGTYCCGDPRNYEFYEAPPSEPAILVSDDRGETWRLATTDDFR